MAEMSTTPQSPYEENLSELNKGNARGFVRLLRVERYYQTKIICDVRVFSLQNIPPYAALSYCWGKAERDKTILFRDFQISWFPYSLGTLAITTHLHTALHRINDYNKGGWLWNDAICINQDSTDEKADQVGRMKTIYSQAEQVYIWLGTIDAESPAEITTMTRLAAGQGFPQQAILALLNRGSDVWWKRLWVLQELCLCFQVQIILGNWYTDWHDFVRSLQKNCDVGIPDKPYEDDMALSNILHRLYRTRKDLQEDLQVEEDAKSSTDSPQTKDASLREFALIIMALDCLRKEFRERGESLGLAKLMMTTAMLGSETSNPLDRIYGLLGLANGARTEIPIDYGASTVEVFAKVAKHLFRYVNPELLFEYWPRGKGMKNGDVDSDTVGCNLPTWMPDFSVPVRANRSLLPFESGFHASQNTEATYTIENYSFHLHIEAISCGAVEKHCHITSGCSSEDILRRINRHLGEVDIPESSQTSLVGIDDVEKTLDLGQKRLRNRFQIHDVFRTTCGLTGFSTEDIQEGDEIIVLFGFETPWVIRPLDVSKKHSRGSTSWSLIGECYVQGVMEGELIDLWEAGKLVSGTYELG